MEANYIINENYAEVYLDEKVYPLIAVKKALLNFYDNTYIKIEYRDNKIIIQFCLMDDKKELEKIIGNFLNEVLRESLRYDIVKETQNLRELIVGRALYTTCIEIDKEQENKVGFDTRKQISKSIEEYNIDDIAINWFDKYGNEKEKKC